MTRPLDVVAAAVHAAYCGCGTPEQAAYDTAQVAVNALTDERVVAHAAQALYEAGWVPEVGHDTTAIVATVLRSLGEA